MYYFLKFIKDFLERCGHYQSLRTLEKETDLTCHKYNENVKFLRSLIFDGDFKSVESFIKPLIDHKTFPYKECLFEIKREEFLELLDEGDDSLNTTNLQNGKITILLNLLKIIETLCDKETFKKLCSLLMCDNIHDVQEYSNWSKYKGRYDVINFIIPNFSQLFDNVFIIIFSQEIMKLVQIYY